VDESSEVGHGQAKRKREKLTWCMYLAIEYVCISYNVQAKCNVDLRATNKHIKLNINVQCPN